MNRSTSHVIFTLQTYKETTNIDTTGLKDPRMHETAKISALYNLGRLYAERQEYSLAISSYKLALARRPDYYAPPSIYNLLGELSLQNMLMRSWAMVTHQHGETKTLKCCANICWNLHSGYILFHKDCSFKDLHENTTSFTKVDLNAELNYCKTNQEGTFLHSVSLKLFSVILKLSSRYY